MQRIDEFRIYYNHTIFPELIRMERHRRRLLWLLSFSVLLLIGLLVLEFYWRVLALSLFLMLPIGLYIAYLLSRVQAFRLSFKPKVMNLILDFIDDGPNMGELKYEPKRFISKRAFLDSLLFASSAPQYQGEDYISGRVGEVDFEWCELNVREFSRVRNRLNYVFRGVFFHAKLQVPIKGKILVWPRAFKQYLMRSIKEFDKKGSIKLGGALSYKPFRSVFMAYATKENSAHYLLSEGMQRAIIKYRKRKGQEVYISFIGSDVYIAVTEPRDLLEPSLFSSNVSFEVIYTFFEDVHSLLQIIETIDTNI